MKSRTRRGTQVRIVLATLLFLLAAFLLSYSLYFLYVFQVYNSTTSYFPWAWGESFNNRVQVDWYSGIGVFLSVIVAGISVGSIFYLKDRLKKQRAELVAAAPYDRGKSFAIIILFVVGIVLILAGVSIASISGLWTGSPASGGSAFGVWGTIVLGLVSVALAIIWKTITD